MLTFWFGAGKHTRINDYNSSDEQLLLIFDDTENAELDLSLTQGPDQANLTTLLLGGEEVCKVAGDEVDLDQIMLLPLTVAQTLGLAPS